MSERRSFLDYLSPKMLERLQEEAKRESERDEMASLMAEAPDAQPRGTRLVRRGRRLKQVNGDVE